LANNATAGGGGKQGKGKEGEERFIWSKNRQGLAQRSDSDPLDWNAKQELLVDKRGGQNEKKRTISHFKLPGGKGKRSLCGSTCQRGDGPVRIFGG